MPNGQKMYNSVIADSQFIAAEALKSLLGENEFISLAGIATSVYELDKILGSTACDLLIIDPAVFDFTENNNLKIIKDRFPGLSVLAFLNSVNKSEFNELTKSGVKNIIYKTAGRDEILTAIEAVLKGKKYYSSEILDIIVETGGRPAEQDTSPLTHSEIEIVRLIAGGLTTKEIAIKRNISFHTVNTHRKNIFRKTGVTNVSELIIHAIKSGWVDNIEYYI